MWKIRWWMSVAALGLVAWGCGKSSTPEPAAPASSDQSGQANLDLASAGAAQANSASPTPAQAQKQSPLEGFDRLSDPREILIRMGRVYSQAPTYSDRGEVVLRYRQGGQLFESRFPMSVVFQRPNKILLRSYEGIVYSDGQKIYGVHEDVPGYVVTRPAPPLLEPDDLYFDPYLKFMLTNREAGQSFQVRLLLVPGFMERMLDQLAQELKLLEPQKVDGETCHVVQVRVPDGELKFYVGHNTAVLRRLDYPVEQLAKQLAQGGPPVEEPSLVAHFHQAQLGGPLDPQLLARPFPKNWKEVRRFVGPAPLRCLAKKSAS